MLPSPRLPLRSGRLALLAPLAAATWLLLAAPEAAAKKSACPGGMVAVGSRFCVDAYEAAVVEIGEKGRARPHPHYLSVKDLRVKAVSKKGVFPQGYISRNEAEGACREAKKRLCSDEEWLTACKGKAASRYPYGEDRREGYCNDAGVSPLNHFFPDSPDAEKYSWATMNDPRLNQLEGGLARTGSTRKCKNSYGAFDMVGNLHEWTAASAGTFRGGYYLDTQINGEGCNYLTTAHDALYHDYSTGFRCCKDVK